MCVSLYVCMCVRACCSRVIGHLRFCVFAGSSEKGVVEVSNCFAVPFNESEDEVTADKTQSLMIHSPSEVGPS